MTSVKAIMTFDREDIAFAATQLHRAVRFSDAYRKHGFMSALSGLLRLSDKSKELKNMSASERTSSPISSSSSSYI